MDLGAGTPPTAALRRSRAAEGTESRSQTADAPTAIIGVDKSIAT